MRHEVSESSEHGELFVFDSVADTVQYSDPNLFQGGRAEFVGEEINEWEELERRSQACWDHGMEVLGMYIERLRKVEIPELKSHMRKTTWSFDADGADDFDPERMAQGEAPFMHKEREEKTGPTEVTIITNTTTPGSMDSDDILWRGAVSIALTMLLEEKGYKVELWVVNGSRLYEGTELPIMTACCLKRCADPIDPSTLINTVSGWFYRTALFTLIKTIGKNQGQRVRYTLGAAYDPTETDLDKISKDELRIYSSGVYTFSGSVDMIVREMNKFAHKGPDAGQK